MILHGSLETLKNTMNKCEISASNSSSYKLSKRFNIITIHYISSLRGSENTQLNRVRTQCAHLVLSKQYLFCSDYT